MKRTRIKICGIGDASTARIAAEAGADAIGLVFVDGSPRQVTIEQARDIVKALPAFVEPVALFVDADADQVMDVAAQVGVSTVQLHGRESPQFVSRLAPLRVIKSLPFDDENMAATVAAWQRHSDNLAGLLIDASPTGERLPGGSGRTFDWEQLAQQLSQPELAVAAPMILAGGLTPHNVARAIETVEPYAVDVSTGVESSRGVKDATLIREFCRAVATATIGV